MPSTLGSFLRSFTWAHSRSLGSEAAELLARALGAGAGPGANPLTIDVDSTICALGVAGRYQARDALAGYRLGLAFAFVIPIIAIASLTHQSERHRLVCRLAITRCGAALDELDVPALFS